MKRMESKKLILLTMVLAFLLYVPVLANADAISWTTEQYTATANTNVNYGSSPPISSSYILHLGPNKNESDSTITSTSMDVFAKSSDPEFWVWGIAEFSGTYTAPVETPFFSFTYDGYYTTTGSVVLSEHYAWLTVTDLSTNTVLYSDSSLSLDNSVYNVLVPTTAGNQIEVDFGAKVFASRWLYPQTENVILNYSTAVAVAPEPISSILFLTGGATLIGRKYIRRKKI